MVSNFLTWILGLFNFLSDISPVQSTTEIFTTLSVVSLVFTILSFFAELLNLIPYIKDIDEEPKKSSIIIFAVVGIILFLFFRLYLDCL